MGHKFTVHIDIIQPSATFVADGNSAKAASTKTTRAMEVWVDVTAIAGGGTVDFEVQASIDGSEFQTIATISAVAVVGVNAVVVNRADQAIGTSLRVKRVLTGITSITHDVKVVRME